MSLAKCRVCRHEVSTLAAQCVNCGTPVRITPASPAAGQASAAERPASVRCSECGHDVSTLAFRCHNCGIPLRAILTPASPFAQEPKHERPRRGRRVAVLRPVPLR